jgi:hypothetical protein
MKQNLMSRALLLGKCAPAASVENVAEAAR